MLDIKQQDNGVTLRVRVQPKASKNEINGLREGVLQLRVTAPPVDGAANQACTEFLAQKLGVAKSKVEVIQGHSGRQKLIRVEGLTVEQARQKLTVN